MKITVTGSLGHISKPLTEILVKAGHEVKVISSSENRSAEITVSGAIPAIGTVSDVAFLSKAFTGADAVYVMVPPTFNFTNWEDYITGIGQNYATAIKEAGVTSVVNLSSIGAHLSEGTGPIAAIHRVENIYDKLEGVDVVHLRPGYFYSNFFNNVDMIKTQGVMGTNFGEETQMILVDPSDIAAVAAEELQGNSSGKAVRYVASDERTAGETAKVLGAAIGKPGLPWLEIKDEDNIKGMLTAGLSDEVATKATQMGAAMRDGRMWEDYPNHKPVLGKVKLEDFAVDFAKAF